MNNGKWRKNVKFNTALCEISNRLMHRMSDQSQIVASAVAIAFNKIFQTRNGLMVA